MHIKVWRCIESLLLRTVVVSSLVNTGESWSVYMSREELTATYFSEYS